MRMRFQVSIVAVGARIWSDFVSGRVSWQRFHSKAADRREDSAA
jgi:hypothetical protein